MTARDPSTAILAACAAQLGALHDIVERAVPWASASFAGTRIELAFTVGGTRSIGAFLACVGEIEFPVRRGFVADVAVTGTRAVTGGTRVLLEALIVDE